MTKEARHRRFLKFKMAFWAIILITMILGYVLDCDRVFLPCVGALLTSAIIETIQILFDKLTKE